MGLGGRKRPPKLGHAAMPLMEYYCPTCKQKFEKMLPTNFTGPLRCPAGHRKVKRVYSALPVLYRGSGFYTTDHRPKRESEPQNSSS
jgi:putative FmdB family regulatory protein